MKALPIIIAIVHLTITSYCQSDQVLSLAQVYKDYFKIGVAVSPRALKTDEAELIRTQFNSMTAENAMKMGPIHPRDTFYNWAGGDSIWAFAERNNMAMRGHTLCWHNQAPQWFFKMSATDTTLVSKEILLSRLHDHISAVVSRYKGKIYAWDVVNEAISDKADEFYRPSLFYKIIGPEFIEFAFKWAHEADPDALLFYNDYNEINPVKREKIYKLVSDLKSKGVPIHGVGLQGHWSIYEPTEQVLEATLKRFSELGLQVQITELDISVYPKGHSSRERRPEDSLTAYTPERETMQVERYKICFDLFRKYNKSISSVTFWNISDRTSWLDNFPVRGRKDYPLLFDKDLKPKRAFGEVVNFVKVGN